MDAEAIELSLEAAAEVGDPTPLVYERLFAARPDLEALFVMGPSAKGHMLDEAFRLIQDLSGAGSYAKGFLQAEWVNHQGLGVAPDDFVIFMPLVRDVVRDMAGVAWTPRMEAAWQEALAAVDNLLASA